MSGCCNNVHLSMDDTFIQWNEILGDPSTSTSLNEYVDQKISGISGNLIELIDEKLNSAVSEIKDEIREDIEEMVLDIDPYRINYKETTVGDTLDMLTSRHSFEVRMQEFPTYEVGQNFPNFQVSWTLSEDPRTLAVLRIRNNAVIEKHILEPSVRSFTFANVSTTETFKVVGTSKGDEMFEASSEAKFLHRVYCGTYGSVSPTNSVITNWSSTLVTSEDKIGKRIFDCENGAYIYFAIPDDLHLTYDFFSNGLKDSNWVYEVKNVTNQFGAVHAYRIYRTANLLHGYNIYIEVESHDWY